MASLARWRPVLEGRAAWTEPAVYTHDERAVVAGDGNRNGASPAAQCGRPDWIDERHHDLRLAMAGEARLRAMRRSGEPEAERYAAIVWHAYGERGEVLNQRSSCAEAVATRFGRPGEQAAWLATLAAKDHPRSDAMKPIAFGNRLIGMAVRAYELDAWESVVPVVVVPEPPQSARARWIAGIVARWEGSRGPRKPGSEEK